MLGRCQRSATPARTYAWSRFTRDANSCFHISIGMEAANRILNQIHNVQATPHLTQHRNESGRQLMRMYRSVDTLDGNDIVCCRHAIAKLASNTNHTMHGNLLHTSLRGRYRCEVPILGTGRGGVTGVRVNNNYLCVIFHRGSHRSDPTGAPCKKLNIVI